MINKIKMSGITYQDRGNRILDISEKDVMFSKLGLTAIMGESGSGKTTLLDIAAGLLEPTTGSVHYGRRDIYGIPTKKDKRQKFLSNLRSVAVQNPNLINGMNVKANLYNVGYLAQPSDQVDFSWIDELIDTFGLRKHIDDFNKMPQDLSGGEQQRLSLARTLVTKPDFLFADEPTARLDSNNSKTVHQLLERVVGMGIGVVVVSHDPTIRSYCDKMYELTDGTIL